MTTIATLSRTQAMNFLVPNPWHATTIEQAVMSQQPGLLGAVTSTGLFIEYNISAKAICIVGHSRLPTVEVADHEPLSPLCETKLTVDFSTSPTGWLIVTATNSLELVMNLIQICPTICDLDIPVTQLSSTNMHVVRLASDLVRSGSSAPRRMPPIVSSCDTPSACTAEPTGVIDFPCESTYFPNPYRAPLSDIMATLWQFFIDTNDIHPGTLLGVWCPVSNALYRPVDIGCDSGCPLFKQVTSAIKVPTVFAGESWFIFCGTPDETEETMRSIYRYFAESPRVPRPIQYKSVDIQGDHIYYPTSMWLYSI